jgi:hypothetical protein
LLVVLAVMTAGVVEAQTPKRAVVAGTLIEDKDGDGVLSAGDGGAQTLVILMQRSLDGGYKCISQQRSDADGKFRFEDLSIADYEITIRWDPGFLDYPADNGNLTLAGSADDLRDGLETYALRLKKLPEGMVAYGPVNPGFGVATACEGLDNPEQPQNTCAKTGPITVVGPGEFSGGINAPAFVLPAGTFRIWYVQPPAAPGVVVCYVEGNSSITFSLPAGTEAARQVNDLAAAPVLDFIAATVRLVGEDGEPVMPGATVTPAVTQVPGNGGSQVRPPDTGDAGLK